MLAVWTLVAVSGIAAGLGGLGGCAQHRQAASRPVEATAFAKPATDTPEATPPAAARPLAEPYALPADQPRPEAQGDTPLITLGGRPARVLPRADELEAVEADTAAPTGAPAGAPPVTPSATGGKAGSGAATSGDTSTSPAPSATTTVAAPPTLSPAAPPPVLEPLTLDATVGQINGEPVYADAFFKDNQLEERLIAESSRRKTQREWLTVANEAISKALVTRVRDELVLADAYADFSGEKRQGLRAFLTKVQSDEISQRGGSAVIAEQELLESTGRTLDQEAKNKLEQELIGYKINQRVRSRAVVTPRQVRREYERNFNEYNEPSTAHFRLIFMPKADAEGDKGKAVRDALAAGKPFDEVASGEANTFNRAEGGRLDVQVRGRLADAEQILADERLTAAARTLAPGQTAGPIAWGEQDDRVAWVHLDSIDRGKSVSLYEAQLNIENRIRDRRLNEERERYFRELLERGSYSDIDTMRARLLAIALERYWKPGAQ